MKESCLNEMVNQFSTQLKLEEESLQKKKPGLSKQGDTKMEDSGKDVDFSNEQLQQDLEEQ